MSTKGKSRRHVRKAVVQRIEESIDISRFNYKAVVRPAKGKARLFGVGTAAVLYLLGFGGGYFGWLSGFVDDQAFGKLVWLLMIPASVVGAVTWAIMDSRLEYPIRRSLAEYVAKLESEGGLLWRFAPLLDQVTVKGVEISDAVNLSRHGRGGEIDPQDYADIMFQLHSLLTSGDGFQIRGEVSKQLEENFGHA